MKNKSISNKFAAYRRLITNARNPEVLALLKTIGVDEPYLNEGDRKYADAVLFQEYKQKEYQEQDLAYDEYFSVRDAVRITFNKTLKLVKLVTRNDKDLQDRLKLKTGRALAIEEWIDQGISLYIAIEQEADLMAKLARFKKTKAVLNGEKEALISLQGLRDNASTEQAQAQEATRKRNEKLEELDDYCVELKGLAELAIDGESQLLEKLGLKAK